MEKNLKLSVIIAVFNEEDTVARVIERVRAVDLPIEIIVVNDCSTDRTKEILDSYAGDGSVRVINHGVNSGKGAAIRTAREHITGDLMIIQDADLEYNPAEFPRL